MEAPLPPLNLLDAFIIVSLVGSVFSACHRGLAREVMHTIMFGIMVGVGILFLKDMDLPKSQEELTKLVISSAFYLGAMYVFMWGAMKLLAPFIMAPDHAFSIRSRFWAGALSIFKLSACILGLNLWFAVHSPDAHPLRLQAFPEMVRNSLVVQLSDKKTDELYRWLAEQKILDYNKFIDKPKTEQQQDSAGISKMLFSDAPAEEESSAPVR